MYHQKLTGIIIGISPHLEFDRTISFFSYELGRILVIAKGTRNIRSRRGFHIDLFNIGSVEVEKTKCGVTGPFYLREIETSKHLHRLKANPAAFTAACIIASFIERTIPLGVPEKELFDITVKTLEALDEKETIEHSLRTYFLKTMRLLGHIPAFVPKRKARMELWRALIDLDPQFILHARRTLGMFSSLESKRSS